MNRRSINLACAPPQFSRTKDFDFSDFLHIEQIAVYADGQSTLAAPTGHPWQIAMDHHGKAG
jgi:hypothetical protein